ncbi:MAG: hypothetical protein Q8900_09345 [Bacillota bacterium]|nr:hypothetical protein [Bacillota bacterium]
MFSINSKTSKIKFKNPKDKFSVEAAKEIGINISDTNNLTTAKILYAYELGLKGKI